MIDVHKFDGRPIELDEGDGHAAAGTARLEDDRVSFGRGRQIVDFEGNMRHRLDQFGIRRSSAATERRTGYSADR
jgi:hypothetical protein